MKNRTNQTYPRITKNRLKAASAFVGLVASGGMAVHAQTDTNAITALQQQNQVLQQRLDALEDLAKKEGIMPSGSTPKFVSSMQQMTISGFVQASYFYNTQHPSSGLSDGYLWNTKDNSFSLNKLKLTVAGAPLATDKWDATYRASLMFGDDAPELNTGGATGLGGVNTSFNDLREAYLEVNVPIGTGLDIKAGELISLLNWESGDGGAANPNFSQGNQWWFTGNGPSAGIQLGYNFTDKIGLTLRVDNGLYQGPVDNNSGKAFSGSLNFKPTADLWFNLIGWYDSQPGGTVVSGLSSIGGYQFTKKLGTGYEVDYFNFNSPGNASDLWSVGGWAWYDFTDKIDLALRADYIGSPDPALGFGPAVRPGAGIAPEVIGSYLGSLTLTLNLKPTPNIKVQPEIRYDYTGIKAGLNGRKDRFTIGCGASYLF
ncbi:MAG TPA: outer membrane beta-barrel protein [Verrucomicrobiae bacterium]|nr:outer membrane beta-barrel protein [Verrucomicrobiae bacterium]